MANAGDPRRGKASDFHGPDGARRRSGRRPRRPALVKGAVRAHTRAVDAGGVGTTPPAGLFVGGSIVSVGPPLSASGQVGIGIDVGSLR